VAAYAASVVCCRRYRYARGSEDRRRDRGA
jgi:hypothetical protein